jgi:hypothetical protein
MPTLKPKVRKTRKRHAKSQKSMIKCRTASSKLVSGNIEGTIWDVEEFCRKSQKNKLIVLDFDGTLVNRYYKGNFGKIRPRPYLQEFLRRINKEYSIIGYSAADPERAAYILLRFLGPIVKFVIPNTKMKNGIKDVSELSSRFSNIVFVDDKRDFIPKEDHIKPVEIKTWNGRSKDRELRRIAEILKV